MDRRCATKSVVPTATLFSDGVSRTSPQDLPAEVKFADGPIAVDTEAMGLVPGRDRLCLVQLSDGKGDEHLVRFKRGSDYSAPNLKALLSDSQRLKLYHFA